MIQLPKAASFLFLFAPAFTAPTFKNAMVLLVRALLVKQRRTITNIVYGAGDLAGGDLSKYHRVFNRSPWSLRQAGRILAGLLLEIAPDRSWIRIAIDCTVAEHKGKKVYGKGCHHDAVKSSSSWATAATCRMT